ncbi:MAG: type I phosphomannose isomerase catalytic subunit [Longimicrobiales bacterium]|nr:type I phosphomannose isomerase catalytic subunit [Longimicrobiales bacterium]
MPLYPFLLQPIYKEKVWGGRALERFGRELPGGPDVGIGESWELADLDATSPSGGGGEGAHTRVRNGPLIDRTLGEVVDDFGALVTGRLDPGPSGKLPLLIKYLDARQNLSVQVHPSPEYAARHPDAHPKSEAWYVVDAEPDAVIYKGLVEGTTREAFEWAVRRGSVTDLLVRVPARPGECHYLPSGTCHALGAGILVAEVQTPSDTTFRVYDWDRTDRELHLEQALECIDYGPVDSKAFEPGTTAGARDAVARDLVDCQHFFLREWTVLRDGRLASESEDMRVLMLVEGEALLAWGSDEAGPLRAGPGDSILLPAALERTEIRARTDLKLLEVTPSSPDPRRIATPLPVIPGPT